MSIRTGVVALPVLLLFAPLAAQAQERPAPTIPDSLVRTVTGPTSDNIPPSVTEMKPEEQAGTSGYFLGIISMLVGGTVGSSVGQSSCPAKTVDRDCVSRHAFTGALIAGTAMIPIGVHLASAERRSLPATLGVSALTGAVLYAAAHAVPGKPIGLATFVALPIQVFTSVRLERKKH
ncbi:MAG TPA: hypothetical protein VF021_12100 [Longimicrobiales bacterium]